MLVLVTVINKPLFVASGQLQGALRINEQEVKSHIGYKPLIRVFNELLLFWKLNLVEDLIVTCGKTIDQKFVHMNGMYCFI